MRNRERATGSTRSRISIAGVTRHPAAPALVLGALLLVDALALAPTLRGMTFLVDEWLILTERREWDAETFLEPFYEHLFIVPVAVFKVLMVSTGIGPHILYALPLIGLHLTSVALVYVVARSRIGPWFALAPAVSILFLGSSYDNMLLPIQVSFLGSIAAGLVMLLALDAKPSRRADILTCVSLALSLACSSVGLVFAIAAFVELAQRRAWRAHIWVALVPLALYAVWYVVYGSRGLEQGGSVRENLPDVTAHMADAAAATLGAMVGLDLAWGRALAALATVGVGYWLVTRRPVSARFFALLAGLVGFWLLGGLARAHLDDPGAARYLYPAAVLVALLIVETLRSTTLDRRWAVVLVSVVAFAAVGNADALRDARDTHRAFSREVSAQFAALEVLGRDNVPSNFVAAPCLAPGISARSYFEMTDDLGSPVDVTRDILEREREEHRDADIVLAAALRDLELPSPSIDASVRPPAVEEAPPETTITDGPCVRFEPTSASGAATFIAEGVVIVRPSADGHVEVSIRRFGDRFLPVGNADPDRPIALPLPVGRITTPWHVRVASRAAVDICTARSPT